MCGGAWHEMPDVVSRQEVPDRGVTAPPRPELIEAGGRSVAGKIFEVRGDVFGVILIVFGVEA